MVPMPGTVVRRGKLEGVNICILYLCFQLVLNFKAKIEKIVLTSYFMEKIFAFAIITFSL